MSKMTGSLIQKSDELLINCIDLSTMLLDFLECLVLSDISYSFHEKTVSAP